MSKTSRRTEGDIPKNRGIQRPTAQRTHLNQRKQGLMQGAGRHSRSFVTFIRPVSVLLYPAGRGRFLEAIDTEQVRGFKIANWSVISHASVLLMSPFNSGL